MLLLALNRLKLPPVTATSSTEKLLEALFSVKPRVAVSPVVKTRSLLVMVAVGRKLSTA